MVAEAQDFSPGRASLVLGYDPKKTVQDIMVEITRYLLTGPLLKIKDFKVSKEIHMNTIDKAVLIYKGMCRLRAG